MNDFAGIPFSEIAERELIACLLVSDQAIADAVNTVSSEDFFRQQNKTLFSAIVDEFEKGKPVDHITIYEKLKSLGRVESAGGAVYISELADLRVNPDNIRQYIDIIKEKSSQRKVLNAVRDIEESIVKGLVDDVANYAETLVLKATEERVVSNEVAIKDLLYPAMERIEERSMTEGGIIGIPTGLKKLDRMTSGFGPGDMIVLAARPSMGKTAMALNWACHSAIELGKSVAVFSLEMDRDSLAERMMASEARVDGMSIRRGEVSEWESQRLVKASNLLHGANIIIDDTPGISPVEMRAKCRRIKHKYGLDLIVVDYLQLMRYPNSNSRLDEVTQISQGIKNIAREMRVPVVALSQLSRSCEQRENKRPMLSDLRDSGSIEQDADLVAFIYREEKYTGPINAAGEDVHGIAELLVAKQRNGPTGFITLNFDEPTMRFEDRE